MTTHNWRRGRLNRISVLLAAGCITLSAGCTSSPAQPISTAPTQLSMAAAPQSPVPDPEAGSLTLVSPAFAPGGLIPIGDSCAGGNSSPPLSWHGRAPAGTSSWAVVMQDLDVSPGPWIQWIVTGIPAQARSVAAGRIPAGALAHRASNGSVGFVGPCPPQGSVHHYRFTLFAVTSSPPLPASATAGHSLTALEKGAAASAGLVGRFAR